jgi:hypothetical protein
MEFTTFPILRVTVGWGLNLHPKKAFCHLSICLCEAQIPGSYAFFKPIEKLANLTKSRAIASKTKAETAKGNEQ